MAIHRQLAMCRRIRMLRENAGLTQIETAEQLGMSQAAYSRLESGGSTITLTRVLQISELFSISLPKLMDGL